jgi:hypothetical protein
MKKKQSAANSRRSQNFLAYGLLVLIWAISLSLSFTSSNAVTLKHYNITEANLHAIQAILSLPTLFIWVALMYAILTFYRYAKQIEGSKDSRGFLLIAYGLGAMLAGMIASGLLSNVSVLMSERSADPASVKTNFVILRNYVSVTAALGTYWCFYRGSQSLLASIKSRFNAAKQYLTVVFPFLVLAVVYLALIFSNPERRVSHDSAINPTFGLPDVLIVFTVALPYLAAWFMGLLALLGIYRYQIKVPGIVYRILFRNLVVGMTLVIGLTIILQLITQFAGFWADKGLGAILLIIAVIYFVIIAAFLIVARGAKQLNKIETLGLES